MEHKLTRAQIIQPKYTMLGFEWQDQRDVEGTGFVRALRSKLTANLPVLLPDLQAIVQDTIAKELATPQRDGSSRWDSTRPMTDCWQGFYTASYSR